MKKKLLIALLSVACITACAFSFSACGNSDSSLKDTYSVYQQSGGTLSYDDWLAYIQSDIDVNAGKKAAYNKYLTTVESGVALGYDAWLKLCTGDGLTVQGTLIDSDNKLTVVYSNGKTAVVGTINTDTLTIKFTNGEEYPVKLTGNN